MRQAAELPAVDAEEPVEDELDAEDVLVLVDEAGFAGLLLDDVPRLSFR
ncbi:hypothetical protein GCM10010218_65010 [Streptomyces mashuensis]|uniref:Uncharacterized protein n=1 Tax=Streptomyces mashuensis TaxID=33904 RepID=A0A919EGW4_9ACTN|nr:hypothetical protein GCM10010218_65010 [Streptomyces mashuensis]